MSQIETIPITLWIAGRSYRIRIKPEDEEKVRFAVKVADERINQLKTGFAGKDDQDFIAMCLLMYATDQAIDKESLSTFQKDLILDINKSIDKALDE